MDRVSLICTMTLRETDHCLALWHDYDLWWKMINIFQHGLEMLLLSMSTLAVRKTATWILYDILWRCLFALHTTYRIIIHHNIVQHDFESHKTDLFRIYTQSSNIALITQTNCLYSMDLTFGLQNATCGSDSLKLSHIIFLFTFS